MDRYFRILEDMETPDRWWLEGFSVDDSVDNTEPCPWQFVNGGTVTPPPQDIEISIDEPGSPFDVSFTTFQVPIVTKAVAECFGPTVQYIPVKMLSNEPLEERGILVVTELVDCLDENRSEFTKYTEADDRPDILGHYKMVLELKVDPERCKGHDVFRIARWQVVIIVSETVRDRLLAIGATGITFQEV